MYWHGLSHRPSQQLNRLCCDFRLLRQKGTNSCHLFYPLCIEQLDSYLARITWHGWFRTCYLSHLLSISSYNLFSLKIRSSMNSPHRLSPRQLAISLDLRSLRILLYTVMSLFSPRRPISWNSNSTLGDPVM